MCSKTTKFDPNLVFTENCLDKLLSQILTCVISIIDSEEDVSLSKYVSKAENIIEIHSVYKFLLDQVQI